MRRNHEITVAALRVSPTGYASTTQRNTHQEEKPKAKARPLNRSTRRMEILATRCGNHGSNREDGIQRMSRTGWMDVVHVQTPLTREAGGEVERWRRRQVRIRTQRVAHRAGARRCGAGEGTRKAGQKGRSRQAGECQARSVKQTGSIVPRSARSSMAWREIAATA